MLPKFDKGVIISSDFNALIYRSDLPIFCCYYFLVNRQYKQVVEIKINARPEVNNADNSDSNAVATDANISKKTAAKHDATSDKVHANSVDQQSDNDAAPEIGDNGHACVADDTDSGIVSNSSKMAAATSGGAAAVGISQGLSQGISQDVSQDETDFSDDSASMSEEECDDAVAGLTAEEETLRLNSNKEKVCILT